MAGNLMQNVSVTNGDSGFNNLKVTEIFQNHYVVLKDADKQAVIASAYSPREMVQIQQLTTYLEKLRDAARTYETKLIPGGNGYDEQKLINFFTSIFNFDQIVEKEKAYATTDGETRAYERYGTIFGLTSNNDNAKNDKNLTKIIADAVQQTVDIVNTNANIGDIKDVFNQQLVYNFLNAVQQTANETLDNTSFKDIAQLLPSMISEGSGLLKALKTKADFEAFYKGLPKNNQQAPIFKPLTSKNNTVMRGVINGAIIELADTLIAANYKGANGIGRIKSISNTGTSTRKLVDLGDITQVFDITNHTITNYNKRVSDEVSQKADGTIIISVPTANQHEEDIKLQISNKFRSFRDDKTDHAVTLQKSKFHTAIPQLAAFASGTIKQTNQEDLLDNLAFWLLNASTGAIYEDERNTIMQIVDSLIMSFMFDDLPSLLDKDANKILVFQINDKVVPSSVILNRMIDFANSQFITTKIYYSNAGDIYRSMKDHGVESSERPNLLRDTILTNSTISAAISKTKWDALFGVI